MFGSHECGTFTMNLKAKFLRAKSVDLIVILHCCIDTLNVTSTYFPHAHDDVSFCSYVISFLVVEIGGNSIF